MDTPSTSKQITVDVPADRVPEFYAFFGRFLAAEGRSGGRGRGRRGGPHGHRCHHRDEAPATRPEPAA
jgi:hypothetical protein